MVFTAQVWFTEKLPSIDSIFARLHSNTQLSMSYDLIRTLIECEELETEDVIYEGSIQEGQSNEYWLTVFGAQNFKTQYLLESTIYTLIQLGGSYAYPLPKWASLEWELARLAI